jgi:hypothetical protein
LPRRPCPASRRPQQGAGDGADAAGDFSSHKIKAGLAADVGIEGRLVGTSAKVEYLDLGKHHPDLSGKFNDRGRVQFPITDNSVCVGINYKFDP